MAWTDPMQVDWAEGVPLRSADMLTYVRDNLLALRALNVAQTIFKPTATISSNSTTFVDADPTNLKVDIDITSDRLLCICTFEASKATNQDAFYDLIVNQDSSNDVRAGDVDDGLARLEFHANYHFRKDMTLIGFWSGLDPSETKTVKLQMRSSNSENARIETGQFVILTALEV